MECFPEPYLKQFARVKGHAYHGWPPYLEATERTSREMFEDFGFGLVCQKLRYAKHKHIGPCPRPAKDWGAPNLENGPAVTPGDGQATQQRAEMI